MANNPFAVFSNNAGHNLRAMKLQFNRLARQNPNRLQTDLAHENRVNHLIDTLEFELLLWQMPYAPTHYEAIDRNLQLSLGQRAREYLSQLQSQPANGSDQYPTVIHSHLETQTQRNACPRPYADPSSSTHPSSPCTYPLSHNPATPRTPSRL